MMDQVTYLHWSIGQPQYYRSCYSVFACGGPYATTIGAEPMMEHNLQKARQLVQESGYDGRPIVVLHVTDIAHLNAAAIVTYTTSGSTTLRAARERPGAPILCLTENIATARRLVITWGVHTVVTQDVRSFEEILQGKCDDLPEQAFEMTGTIDDVRAKAAELAKRG